ncbi:hypothetical protein N8208_01885 [Planktomarina temperata]|nr:hypothetical protein [Planktomarina temperata]
MKPILILGNGPGLNLLNFNKINTQHIDVLGMNRISEKFLRSDKWPLTHYLNVTENTIKIDSWTKSCVIAVERTPVSIISKEIAQHLTISGLDNVTEIDVDFGGHARRYNDITPAEIQWRKEGAYDKYGSSAHVAFQWAARSGYKQIYLAGFDLNFKNQPLLTRILKKLKIDFFYNDKNHFTKSYGTPGLPGQELNRNMLSMHATSMINFARLNITVKKINTGGDLTLYQWQEIDDFYEEIKQ